MLSNYVKLALKVLMRRKVFTVISLFGIGFTLTVLVVASAVLDHLFGEHAPEIHRARSMAIYDMEMSGPDWSSGSSCGYYFLDTYARDLPGVEELTLIGDTSSVISYKDGRKIESELMRTDGAFWRVYAFDFVEGEPFTGRDDAEGRAVAVINEATRERFFGEGAQALGKEIVADNQSFSVVGVVRNVALTRKLPYAEIWVPIGTAKTTSYRHQWLGGFRAVVLARSRADLPAIRSEFASRIEDLELPNPDRYDTLEAAFETPVERVARGLFDSARGEARAGLFHVTVVGMMLLFMVLPAVNLINLNLSRIMERASEIGVRKSFGASSRVLVGQFVIENVILTLIGGVLGYLASAGVLAILNSIGLLPYAVFTLNLKVFGYGLLLAVTFGLVSGVYPAWKMSRLNPVEALRGRTL